jgi:hypothetical protein
MMNDLMRWRIWRLLLLNSKAVFCLPHIDGDAGELDSVGQAPVIRRTYPVIPLCPQVQAINPFSSIYF